LVFLLPFWLCLLVFRRPVHPKDMNTCCFNWDTALF
jgi:hypothetical protein